MSGTEHGHEHHGGARGGLGWELLDAIVAACAIGVCVLAGELAYRVWAARRETVRYDLTAAGRAATAEPRQDQPEPEPAA